MYILAKPSTRILHTFPVTTAPLLLSKKTGGFSIEAEKGSNYRYT